MNYVSVMDLLPGDILLCRGSGPASDLIVLFDGSPYSHSALYVGLVDGEHTVVQTIGKGTGYYPLKMFKRVLFTDVFRFNKNNYYLGEMPYPFEPIREVAHQYAQSGIRYAYNHLILLAILSITRQISMSHRTKILLREVLDAAADYLFKIMDNGKRLMTCSELVYRCFDEADYNKKYQFSVSALTQSELMRGIDNLFSRTLNTETLSKVDIALIKAKQNFVKVWQQTGQISCSNINAPTCIVASCILPKDISDSTDLKKIGRLNLKH